MGNKICVDKKPSSIENIISFKFESLQHSEIKDLNKKNNNLYQHLNMWCLNDNISEKLCQFDNPNIKNNQQKINGENNSTTKNELNENIMEEEKKIIIAPVDLANIYKNHFLLDSHNVYILLLIFKKDEETDIENSPFPTGFWGIIESSSNMTPRGLLFAFPSQQNSQNLESFLLSKRELNDSEFKYMLFIWNGKKSTAFLRSISLMKAFDLDKALMNPCLVQYIYSGYYFNEKGSILQSDSGCTFLGDVINNSVESSEDTSNPSTDKINNFHETVYLFKLLYPKIKPKSKNKKQKKIDAQNENGYSIGNNLNDNLNKNKQQNILFKGFNNEFLFSGTKKSFYDSFTEIDVVSTSSKNNLCIIDEKNYYNGFSENFRNNNNLEKSNLSNSINKNVVMPPKLNLNIANKINSIGSVDDTSGSKRTGSAANSKEENKSSSNNIGGVNKQKGNNFIPSISYQINNLKEGNKNDYNDLDNEDEECLEDDDQDLDLIPTNKALINKDKSSLKKIKIPKLMVSLQKNILNEEKLTERAKIKSEQEENLNLLPESTLISTSKHILNKMNNLGLNKVNLSGINQINNNNLNSNRNIQPDSENTDSINIKALNEDYSLKDSERKKIISDYYSKHLSEIIPNFLYLSSYNAAKNKNLLESNKITYIINCAADFCDNYFEQEKKYTYLSFYIKDHVLENIECIFYECIKFIENVKEKGGRVLVHCIQGISRSVTIVMAYLIYKNKFTYDKAFNLVQNKREISSPNFGFSIQLQNFYMRLYEPPSKYRYIPKIFAVGSFQNEQPDKIVCRLMNEPFYENKENGIPRMLDKRGVFIIVSLTNVYLWIGSKISSTVKDLYLKTAKEYINIIKEYEHAPVGDKGPIIVYDEKESVEFINDLLKTKEKIERFKSKRSDIFPEWNAWYKEIKIGVKVNVNERNNGGNLNDNNNDEIKKGFFQYPNEKPDAVLDLDDLNNETFLVACIYQKSKSKIFVWKGRFVDIGDNAYNGYKNKVKNIFFSQFNLSDEDYNKIEFINEIPLEESDEFLSFI